MFSLIQESSIHKNRGIWLILAIALAVRLGAAVYWHRSATADTGFFRLGDSDGYWVLASHLARGEAYQYGSENAAIFRAPLMPLFLSPFTLISDRWTAVLAARCFGAAVGTLVVYLVALLAWQASGMHYRFSTDGPHITSAATKADGSSQFADKFRKRAAYCAALIASFHPSAIGISIVLLSEMIFVPLMLVYLLQCSRWLPAVTSLLHSTSPLAVDAQRKNATINASSRQLAWRAFVTGVIGGLATLARPSWLLFAPLAFLLGLIFVNRRVQFVQLMLLVLLGTSVAMSPWWVRNFSVTGKFVLTTLQVGPSLYDSFHPGASGGSDEGMQFMRQIEAAQTEADRQAIESDPMSLEGTFEWRLNRRASQLAASCCWNHPAEVLRLAWAKLCKTWNLWPNGGEVGSPMIRLAISLGTLFVVVLAIVGSRATWQHHPALLAICWSPCLYFTLLHMVFVGSVRYREPAIVVLVAVAGCALARLLFQNNPSTKDCSRVQQAEPDSSTG